MPTGFRVADEATYEATYLGTAQNLLQALNQSPRVKRLIYISSCAVYGDRQGDWVDETSPIFPTDSRSRVLYEAELVSAIEFARLNELNGIYNLVDDSKLAVREQVDLVCSQYGLPPAHWDPSQPSLRRKSLRVSNQKFKAAGYQLIHPQLLI